MCNSLRARYSEPITSEEQSHQDEQDEQDYIGNEIRLIRFIVVLPFFSCFFLKIPVKSNSVPAVSHRLPTSIRGSSSEFTDI